MTLADHLARQRNRDAAERTLMAWIRTCLSLISFGFGLDTIVVTLNRNLPGARAGTELGVRLVAVAFVLTGILAILAAALQHRRVLRKLRRDDFIYQDEPSIAMATAVLLCLIGLFALLLLTVGALTS